jgi:hypothetical protein
MRAAALAAGLLCTSAGCSAGLESDQPLFTAGAEAPRPGLWAMLQEGCAAPLGRAVQDWPECASPAWVKDGAVTLIVSAPVRSDFVISEGRPWIGRVGSRAPDGKPEAGYSYFVVEPEGASPFQGARISAIGCLEDLPDCKASSEDEVRRAALAPAASRSARSG